MTRTREKSGKGNHGQVGDYDWEAEGFSLGGHEDDQVVGRVGHGGEARRNVFGGAFSGGGFGVVLVFEFIVDFSIRVLASVGGDSVSTT